MAIADTTAPRFSPQPQPSRLAAAGVLYAEDFDDDGQAQDVPSHPAPEPELIEPVFTAEELETARADARAVGRAEAERGVAASRVQVLQLIASAMAEAREEAQQIAQQVAEAVARCTLTSLAACLPALCSQHGGDELRALMRVVLPALTNEPRITVKLHPHMVPVVRDEIASLDLDAADRITLQPSETVAPGDARVSWSDGAAERHATRAQAAVQEALAVLGLLECHSRQKETVDA